MVQGFQTPSSLTLRRNNFFSCYIDIFHVLKKVQKNYHTKRSTFFSQKWKRSCPRARPRSGLVRPRASSSSASCKGLVLPGGSFSFEDWRSEEESGKPPAICFLLCTRRDHPVGRLEKKHSSSRACISDASLGVAAKLTTGPGTGDWRGRSPPPSAERHPPPDPPPEFYRVESTSRCPCPSPLITDIRMPRAAYVLVSLSLRGGHRRLCGPKGDSARAAGAHVCAQTLAERSPWAGSGPLPPPSFPHWSPSPVTVSHGVHGLSLLRRLTLYLTRCESSNLTSGPGASSVSRMASAASFAGDMCLHPLGRVPREGKSSVSSWGCSGGFPWLREDLSLPP